MNVCMYVCIYSCDILIICAIIINVIIKIILLFYFTGLNQFYKVEILHIYGTFVLLISGNPSILRVFRETIYG